MNTTALYDYYHYKSGLQYNNMNALVAKALYYVIEHFFLEMIPAFVLSFCCRRQRACNFFNAMFENLFQIWEIAPVQIIYVHKRSNARVKGRRYYNLILIDSYKAFLEIDIIAHTGQYNRNEFYYIFIQERDHLLPNEIQRILEYCWRHYLINCNVQIQNTQGEVLIYTYFPFTAEYCDQVVPVQINQFNGSHLVKPELFPNKLKDFHGCSLRAAVWHVPPFLRLHTDEHGVSSSIVGGFEGYLLLTLAKHLNFTIQLKIPPNNEQRGIVSGNKTSGALNMLQNRLVDLSLGAFGQREDRDRIVSGTLSYYQSFQVFVVLESDFKPTSFDAFLYPFNYDIWLLLIITFVAVAVTFKLQMLLTMQYTGQQQQSILNFFDTFEVLVGLPTTITDTSFSRCFLFLKWMLFSLIMRTVYQGLLFHLIRSNLSIKMPMSFDDLIVYNFTSVMIQTGNVSLLNVLNNYKLKNIMLPTTVDWAAFAYIEKHRRKHLVAIGPIDFLLNYCRDFRKAGVFKVLPEHIFNYQATMYFTKHSYLIDQFSNIIHWIRAMGLINRWAAWELDLNYFAQHHNLSNNIFGFEELYVAFVLVLIGLLLSCFIFMMEILSRHSATLRNLLDRL